jgi:hypothetical protein
MKWMIKHYRHVRHCDCWDEMNHTCMFERMEEIEQNQYSGTNLGDFEQCFSELD